MRKKQYVHVRHDNGAEEGAACPQYGAALPRGLDWFGWSCRVNPLTIIGGLASTTGPRLLRSHEAREDKEQ